MKAILIVDIPEKHIGKLHFVTVSTPKDKITHIGFATSQRFPIKMQVRDDTSDRYGLDDNPYCLGWNSCLDFISDNDVQKISVSIQEVSDDNENKEI